MISYLYISCHLKFLAKQKNRHRDSSAALHSLGSFATAHRHTTVCLSPAGQTLSSGSNQHLYQKHTARVCFARLRCFLNNKIFSKNLTGYGAALKNFKPALLLRGLTIFRGGDTGIVPLRYTPLVRSLPLTGILSSASHLRVEPFLRVRTSIFIKNKNTPPGCVFIFGGDTGIRTLDPMIKSHLLYQLSYVSKTEPPFGVQGIFWHIKKRKSSKKMRILKFFAPVSGYIKVDSDTIPFLNWKTKC